MCEVCRRTAPSQGASFMAGTRVLTIRWHRRMFLFVPSLPYQSLFRQPTLTPPRGGPSHRRFILIHPFGLPLARLESRIDSHLGLCPLATDPTVTNDAPTDWRSVRALTEWMVIHTQNVQPRVALYPCVPCKRWFSAG